MSQNQNTPIVNRASGAVLGFLAAGVLFAALAVVVKFSVSVPAIDADRNAAITQALFQIRTNESAALDMPGWVDPSRGIVRLPIETAMQLAAQKGDTLAQLLTLGVGLMVVLFGRRYKAGWRTHTHMIAIGLATVAITWLGIQQSWQVIARTVHPQSQQEYEHLLALGNSLMNTNKIVYIAALIWWIVWLWRDEPGTETPLAVEPEPTPETTPTPEPTESPVEK